MGQGGSSIRLHGQTYTRLKEIQRDDESMLDALNRILPEDVDEVEQIDEEAVAIPTPPEISERVNKMAGKNVSANDVIDQLIEQHTEETADDNHGDNQ